MPQLVAAVAQIGGIDLARLIGPGRTGWPVTLRAAIIIAAVDVMKKGWNEIGRALGGRNHASIITAYRTAQRRLVVDGEFRRLVVQVLAIARAIVGTEPAMPRIERER